MNFSLKQGKTFKRIPHKGMIALITLYRLVFSPSVGLLRYIPFYPRSTCIFYPTCSEYAITCFKKYSFFTALIRSTRRISRCHRNNEPSVDLP